jgi:hypothetical protein
MATTTIVANWGRDDNDEGRGCFYTMDTVPRRRRMMTDVVGRPGDFFHLFPFVSN